MQSMFAADLARIVQSERRTEACHERLVRFARQQGNRNDRLAVRKATSRTALFELSPQVCAGCVS